MKNKIFEIKNELVEKRSLSIDSYAELIRGRDETLASELRAIALAERERYYGREVYIRGLIEISNICKNDCLYCGIRRSNSSCERYRLKKEEILECCEKGYPLGFRTFVLQGGEDPFYSDEYLCDVVSEIRSRFPDCAITLSMGERSRESYERLFNAGANRYLLRHESATKEHYERLHPSAMSFENRMRCLSDLREIGYQVGCGFMVGSPYQTERDIARDLKFIEEFRPHMCGIGPFIPHRATPFGEFEKGSAELTCYLLSIIRIISPGILLPATTALGSIGQGGRERGILSGANVIMPNLSPQSLRAKYEIYEGKLSSGAESAQEIDKLKEDMRVIGYEIVCHRGDTRVF
ncbi:MAG: [Clostridia bacterium]|nr:[FeFe] hydrogenase H-cluster radical SAM maturase HydE [Clostridia bacterium]